MSRKMAQTHRLGYLRKSVKFNYKAYRRPRAFRNTVKSRNHLWFEEGNFGNDFEGDDFEDEESEWSSEGEDLEEETDQEGIHNDGYEEDDEKEEFEEGFEVSDDVEDDSSQNEDEESEESSEGEDLEEETDQDGIRNDGYDEDDEKEEFEVSDDVEDDSSQNEDEESEEGQLEEHFEEEEFGGEVGEGVESEEDSEGVNSEGDHSDGVGSREEKSEKENSEIKDSEVEEELAMALVNARSVMKFIIHRDRTLIDLIQRSGLDVLLISETWLPTENLTSGDFRRILPPGYNIVDEPRFYGRGGGVAIVHHKDLICRQARFNFPETFEFVAATVRRPGSREAVLVVCVYRPPGGTVTELSEDFLSELHELLSDIYARYENVIIGGDFNIWFDCPEMTVTKDFEDFMRDNGLVQHVCRPTHQGGHILDFVLSRPNIKITNISVQRNEFSDHNTVFFKARF